MKLVLLLSLFYKRRKLRLREVIISSHRCGYKYIFSERQQKPSSTKLPYSVPFLRKGAGIQVRDNYLTILSSSGSFSLWGERRKGWRPPPPTPLWIWVSSPRNRGFALGSGTATPAADASASAWAAPRTGSHSPVHACSDQLVITAPVLPASGYQGAPRHNRACGEGWRSRGQGAERWGVGDRGLELRTAASLLRLLVFLHRLLSLCADHTVGP